MARFYTEGDKHRFSKEDNEENNNTIEFMLLVFKF